ncbi:copper resistance D family protein [Massilia sp. MS-15]|uniref:copper resistance D family protein n=1 Tax=Massilia sp. MS-15 TaxID=2878200 RepID=UPI001CD33FB8|nr:CopD family protein [Massilia sp. MS-15]MCA1247308.1 CopD family protein [Massilia sp. MS-15]
MLQRVLTVVLNLSFALFAGGSAASLWLRARHSPWAATLLPRLRRVLLVACGAAMLAHVAILWVEAASMAEVPLAEAWPAVRSVLTATHYGLAWTIGAVALVVTGATCAAGSRAQAGSAATALRIAAIGVLLYSRSMVSHAGAGGDFTWAVAVDWVHLVLASVWTGAVIVAGLLALRLLPNDELASRSDCACYVEALSRSATIALAGILVTGAISTWRVLASPADLIGNPYGTTLLIKVGLVLCAAALGGVNRFLVMPQLIASLQAAGPPQRKASRRFARVLQAEAVILLAVIIAAAFLTSTPPPMAD